MPNPSLAKCYTLAMAEGRSRTLLWVLIGGGAFFLFVLAVFTLVYLTLHATGEAGIGGFGDRIGVVDLEGVILSPQPVVGQLKKFGDDSSIKAIILHVNSPGGGVAASEEIYREVKRIRVKMCDRRAALADLGRHLGLFVDPSVLNVSQNNYFSEAPPSMADWKKEIAAHASHALPKRSPLDGDHPQVIETKRKRVARPSD